MRCKGIPLLLLSGFVGAAAWGADKQLGGLVMALRGTTTPPITAMSEIPSGTLLKLEPGAELTFLHYAHCKLVTVSGGMLTVTRSEYNTDGKIVSEKDGPCPRVHQLAGSSPGTTGGLVMRGIGEPRWPLDREIVFAGRGSGALQSAAIYSEGRTDAPVLMLDVSGHQARLPSEPPLSPNQRYVMRLTLVDRPQPLDIPFIGTAPDGSILLVVLRAGH